MRDQARAGAAASVAAFDHSDVPAAGRQTLTETHEAEPPEPDVPAWADIDPGEHHETAKAAPAAAEEAEPTIEDADLEAGGAHEGEAEADSVAHAASASGGATAHAASSHGHGHAHPYYAKTDKFNRKQHRGRPQVKTLVIHHDFPRFVITSGSATQAFDSIKTGTHVTINVAHVRKLVVDGSPHPVACVLTRTVSKGSGWTRLSDLAKDPAAQAHLAHLTNHAALGHTPSAPSLKSMAHHAMKFKVNGPKHSSYRLTGHLSSQSKSNLAHYLERPSHSAEDPEGFYNICLNLPQHGTPPVQVDTALPGSHFFVATTREVAVYKSGHTEAAKKIRWAFGCPGIHRNGHWVPDRSRRGWVPLSVLEKA
jgi:hypothetical protein